MNPPAALHGAMSRERKPFTYTPGGLDLSEIKSERMAKRLMINAMNQGVPEVPIQPVQSPPANHIAVPNFNCLPVQVFPSFNLPANPKSLLRTRSHPNQPKEPLVPRVPPPQTSQFSKPNTTDYKNMLYNQTNNNSSNYQRPTSMYEYNAVPNSANTLPRTNYNSNQPVPFLPEISYEAEYLQAAPRRSNDFRIPPVKAPEYKHETKPLKSQSSGNDDFENRLPSHLDENIHAFQPFSRSNNGFNTVISELECQYENKPITSGFLDVFETKQKNSNESLSITEPDISVKSEITDFSKNDPNMYDKIPDLDITVKTEMIDLNERKQEEDYKSASITDLNISVKTEIVDLDTDEQKTSQTENNSIDLISDMNISIKTAIVDIDNIHGNAIEEENKLANNFNTSKSEYREPSKEEHVALELSIKPVAVSSTPISAEHLEEPETDDEQRVVKVVKKKENKSEVQNGDQNGDQEAQMTVKLPSKKSAAKTETKVEVVKKQLPDGSIEEVKTTTTKTTVDGKTTISTKTETTIIPKEEEDEVEEVEEEEEEVEENGDDEVVEEVVVKKSPVVENGHKIVKEEEHTETTVVKKVAVVHKQEPEEVEQEEEEEIEEEIQEEVKPSEQEPKVDVKEEEVDEEIEEVEAIEEEVAQKIETQKKKDADEEEEEEEEEVIEKPKEVRKSEEPAEDEEEVEEESEEVEEKVDEVKVKQSEPTKAQKDEESEYTEEEYESEKEEIPKPAPESPKEETVKQEVEIENTKKEVKQEPEEEQKEAVKEEKPETPSTLKPEPSVPLREPSIPLEKVEDVEIKPIGLTTESVSKSSTENTEIITSNEKTTGPLTMQTEYNRIENTVTVNRTTKTLDHSYEQLTQHGIPTVKSYFVPPNIERISTSPQPSRPYQPVYPPTADQPQERRHSLLLERLSMERQVPSADIYQNAYQYNNQTHDQQRQWSQEPQAEVLTISNVKPSAITKNQQWYQQQHQQHQQHQQQSKNVVFNNVATPASPPAVSQLWAQSQPSSQPAQPQFQPSFQPQYQPPSQPQYQPTSQTAQPQYQPPSQHPQSHYQPTYNENTTQERSSSVYQQSSYQPYTPKPTTWGSNSLTSTDTLSNTYNTQQNQYSLQNQNTIDSYQKSTQQYSSSYVPPPWEQDSSYVADVSSQPQNYYQPPPAANSFSPGSNQGWTLTPPKSKFSKPPPTAYIPPAPNQSFVKSVTAEQQRAQGKKTYYSEYERRYITVPESNYVPGETKYQPQPDPSPQYYYDNNEPVESVEPQWRKELREFTEKTTTQQTEQTSVKPPWEEDAIYNKPPSNTITYTATPTWSQTLRPRSWRERSFESEYVGSQEFPKTSTLGRGRPLSSYAKNNIDTIPERTRGVSVDRYNPNSYQSPIAAGVVAEHPPVQTHTLKVVPPAKSYHNPNVPAYHAGPRAVAEPKEHVTYPQARNWGAADSRESPIQSRSFKYLQWITGTED